MKNRLLPTLLLLMMTATGFAQSKYDMGKPFGFATSVSRTEKGSFRLTGGGEYAMPIKGNHITLLSRNLPDEIRQHVGPTLF